MNSFAPGNVNGVATNSSFIVKNIANPAKVIRIFNYPINSLGSRDLMLIPGVSDSNIRASLLKGECNNKLQSQEIVVLYSDLNLIQFNSAQKTFLQNAGITIGLDIGGTNDWLLENDPPEPNNTYMATYNGSLIQSESWQRSDTTLIKQINYTFTGSTLTKEVRQVFGNDGITIISQLTINYFYTGSTLTSYTATRDI